MAQALQAVHTEDPKQKIRDALDETIGQIKVLGARVLVGIYVRPSEIRTAGGVVIQLAAQTREEDKYQGKVGLVLGLGPLAFAEDASHRWGGTVPKVGDWVQFQVYETKPFEARTKTTASENHRCRYVEDVDILAILPEPDLIR